MSINAFSCVLTYVHKYTYTIRVKQKHTVSIKIKENDAYRSTKDSQWSNSIIAFNQHKKAEHQNNWCNMYISLVVKGDN